MPFNYKYEQENMDAICPGSKTLTLGPENLLYWNECWYLMGEISDVKRLASQE